jgi:hypothetical protein
VRSRLEPGATASLTSNFLVAELEQAFAFAILAFHFRFARILFHILPVPLQLVRDQVTILKKLSAQIAKTWMDWHRLGLAQAWGFAHGNAERLRPWPVFS